MGRITASRKSLKPDPKYGSILASKFVNCLMHEGKKSVAQKVFYDALDIIKEKLPNEGAAMSKRENVHRMADANKAFAHFAW